MADKKKVERKARKIEERQALPEFHAGDTIKVSSKFREGDKERVQIFQGTVIQMKGRDESRTFTVRKVTRGIGVERIYPLHSPTLVKVEVKKHGKVRRARLYYLRDKKGKETRIQALTETPSGEKPARPEAVETK
jgi:large subunit ribosomal protein L19